MRRGRGKSFLDPHGDQIQTGQQSCWDKTPEAVFEPAKFKRGFGLITLNRLSLRVFLERPFRKCCVVGSKGESVYRVPPPLFKVMF